MQQINTLFAAAPRSISFGTWSLEQGLNVTDGAVFWMNPGEHAA